MNILLLGSGGRECALAWKIKQSPKTDRLYIAPGNAGTASIGTNVEISATDFDALGRFAVENRVDMVVVGPEDPLVKGIYDYFNDHDELKHIPVIGPSKEGARLEGSKEFAKGFMMRHHIPTARYQSFTPREPRRRIPPSSKPSKPPMCSKPTAWLPVKGCSSSTTCKRPKRS